MCPYYEGMTSTDFNSGPCPSGGEHDFSASHTVTLDTWGAKTRRAYHCSFCGENKPSFTRAPMNDGGAIYTFDGDPRFRIVAEVHQSYAGAHGDQPIFGRTSSDGIPSITGWHVEVEGSRKMFSPSKLLKDAKAKVADADYRAWALERVAQQEGN